MTAPHAPIPLHRLVSITRPTDEIVGEILSLPIPAGKGKWTYMVRNVPNHPGTLHELDAELLKPHEPSYGLRFYVHYANIVADNPEHPRHQEIIDDILRRRHAVIVPLGDNGVAIASATRAPKPLWSDALWKPNGIRIDHIRTEILRTSHGVVISN